QPIPLGEVEALRRAEVEADEVANKKRIATEARSAIRIAVAVVVEVNVGGKPGRERLVAARLEDAPQLPAAEDHAVRAMESLEIIHVPQTAYHHSMRDVGVAGASLVAEQQALLRLFRVVARVGGHHRGRVRSVVNHL